MLLEVPYRWYNKETYLHTIQYLVGLDLGQVDFISKQNLKR